MGDYLEEGKRALEEYRVKEILEEASGLGIGLSVRGEEDELHILFQPKSAATPEFLKRLRENKRTVIRHLMAQAFSSPVWEW